MWISFRNVAELFTVSKESVDALRQENAALKAENAAIKSELLSAKVNLDWLRVQYNQAQTERTALMNRNFGIQAPVPQLHPATGSYLPTAGTQDSILDRMPTLSDLGFNDVGDEVAEKLGLPVYGK